MSWQSEIGTDAFDTDVMMKNIVFHDPYPFYNSSSTTANIGTFSLGGSGVGGPTIDYDHWIRYIVPIKYQKIAIFILQEGMGRLVGMSYSSYYNNGLYGHNYNNLSTINYFWGNMSQIVQQAIYSGIFKEKAGDGNDVLKGLL